MTTHNDLDRQLNSFLRDGPEELPDASFDAVRDRTEQTRQRVVLGPWRVPEMNKLVSIGLGTAAVVVVTLFVGAQLFGSPTGGVGAPGDATATLEPTATPVPSIAEPSPSGDARPPCGSGRPDRDCLVAEGPFAWFEPATPPEPGEDGPPITVTIPASGWTYTPDGALSKGDHASHLWTSGELPESALLATSTTARIVVYDDPCQWEYDVPDPPLTTADAVAAALAAQPSRDASDPVDVTVGGYPGKEITLHVPEAGRFSDTDGFTECFRHVYASFSPEGWPGEGGGTPGRVHQGPGQIDTFWIVDVDGAIVIINAMYRADTPADRIEEMRSIAESARFEAP